MSVLAPDHLRGRYQGAFGLTWGAALVLGPILGTTLFALNPPVLWETCLILGLAGAALVLRK